MGLKENEINLFFCRDQTPLLKLTRIGKDARRHGCELPARVIPI
jgi:hypothetical protein